MGPREWIHNRVDRFLMGLSIKSEEAHRLARELARLTSESMTKAVTDTLGEHLARIRRAEAPGPTEPASRSFFREVGRA